MIDYVKDGIVVQGQQMRWVQVESESDLALLADYGYVPGTIAHTPDWSQMWGLSADGTWKAMEV